MDLTVCFICLNIINVDEMTNRLAAIDGVGGDTGVKPQHRLRHLHRPSPSF